MADELEIGEKPRLASPAAVRFVAVFAALLTLGAIGWAVNVYDTYLGLELYTEQYLGGMLTLALPLVFITQPAKRKTPRIHVPWYDLAAAAAALLSAGYMAWKFPVLAEAVVERPLDGMIAGLTVIVLVLEGLRRTTGNVLFGLVIIFLALALVGHLIPGELAGRPLAWDKLAYYLAWDPTAILGTPMIIVTTVVTAFVFFGNVLFKSGGSRFFTEISMVLMGRYRGGPAKISVFASGLFGSISGSVVSNVVSTGVITIPLMRNGGYKAHDAGAIEATASTGGQLMPPIMGVAAFLMADFLQIPYASVVLAALIPAILYYVALFVQADLEAARSGIDRVAAEEIPNGWQVLKAGWFFPVPFAVLIVALFWWNFSPELSALSSAAVIIATAMVLGYKGKRLGIVDLLDALRATGMAVLNIVMIGAAAGIIIGVLNISGLGFGLTLFLVKLGGGNLIVMLLLAAVICIVLGMGMPTIGVYLLLATLVAPSLVEVGVAPIAAHLFILYFGMMSMITPPVAIAAFAAATLTNSDPMRTGFAAMRFGWLAFVIPFLFIASPSLLMEGTAVEVGLAFVTALGGVWLVSIGLMGHLFRSIGPAFRILYVAAGLALLFPAGAGAWGAQSDIAGTVVGALLVLCELIMRRKASRPA